LQSNLNWQKKTTGDFYQINLKDCSFRPDSLISMPPQAVLVSNWLISKKSSPQKPS
jgi:hypothetical protein